MAKKRHKLPAWALVLLLIAIVGGSTLFICAVAGVFNPKTISLDPDYYASTSSLENSDGDYIELLSADRYEELVNQKKSLLLFVDQTDCVNANRLRGFLNQYIAETGVKPYRIMFSDLKNTSLHSIVKYYPSVVIFSKGQPIKYLDPSADDDSEEFNDYTAFKTWLDETIVAE